MCARRRRAENAERGSERPSGCCGDARREPRPFKFFLDRNYDGVKIYNSVRQDLVPIIAAEAHAHGLRVTGHVPVHMLAHEAVRAGYDGIEPIVRAGVVFDSAAVYETVSVRPLNEPVPKHSPDSRRYGAR